MHTTANTAAADGLGHLSSIILTSIRNDYQCCFVRGNNPKRIFIELSYVEEMMQLPGGARGCEDNCCIAAVRCRGCDPIIRGMYDVQTSSK